VALLLSDEGNDGKKSTNVVAVDVVEGEQKVLLSVQRRCRITKLQILVVLRSHSREL